VNLIINQMDPLTKEERSALMAKVRSTGNRSTESRLRMALIRNGVRGWQLHPRDIPGKPDFWFADVKLAVFVDGCFWHGCRRCLRLPQQNREYWSAKIKANLFRARTLSRQLRHKGIKVIRIWEHDLKRSSDVEAAVRRVLVGSSKQVPPNLL
jgi:DNA mismatch endonuclease, patch repair protein